MLLTLGNSKMKKTAKANNVTIAAFTRPAGLTCARAGVCMNWCYAQQGPYLFKGPRLHAINNWHVSKTPEFITLVNAELTLLKAKGKPVWVRIHDAGDFAGDAEYAKRWQTIMEVNKDVNFYAYTKEHVLLNSLGFSSIPNFTMLCSEGGLDDNKIVGTCVKVVPEGTTTLPEGYVFADMDDDLSSVRAAKEGKNIALLAHGVRKKKVV